MKSRPDVPLARALRLARIAGVGWPIAQVALSLVHGLLPLLGLWLMKEIVDAVAAGVAAGDDAAARGAAFERTLWLTAFAAGTALLGAVSRAVGGIATEAHGHRVAERVADRLHAQSLALDLEFYETPAHHDTLHRAQAEAPHRPARIVADIGSLLQSLVLLAGMGTLLVALHWSVPLVVTAAAVPAVLVRLRHGRRRFAWQQQSTGEQREGLYLGSLLTARGAAKDVRVFDLGPALDRRYRQVRDRLRDESLALSRRRAVADVLAQLTSTAALFGSYAWLGWLTITGTTTLGELVMFATAVQRAQGAVGGALTALAGLLEHALFLQHYFEFLDLEPRIRARTPGRVAPRIERGIRFEGVGFLYPGQTVRVLDGLDLELAAGERLALVGENGAGKSTLVKLLCRLYDPDAGRILCDGVDVREYEPGSWRARLAVMFQDAFPFELGVRDNLLLRGAPRRPDGALAAAAAAAGDGDDGADDDGGDARHRDEQAARLAGVHERIARLPAGYDTRLGRRFAGGEELSAGEWKKLLLARALRKHADLVVLDEPTAAADPRAEEELLARLAARPRDHTLLIVSQRPAALRFCDRVAVLARGRIAEHGNFAELARRGSALRRWLGPQSIT